jgi:hypothetical protein
VATIAMLGGMPAPATAADTAADAARAVVDEAVLSSAAVAHFESGRALEAAAELPRARQAYLRSAAVDPAGRWARRADIRARALEVAEDPAMAAVVTRFATLRAEYTPQNAEQTWVAVNALAASVPGGPVRAELDDWIAREALHIRRDALTAWNTWARSARDPATPPDRVLGAIDGMLDSAALADRFEQTQAAIAEVVARRSDLPELDTGRLADEVRDQQMRFVFDRIAWVALPLFALAVVLGRPWRALARRETWRAVPWKGLLFIGWLFAFAAFLSENWHDETGIDALSAIPVAWACHVGGWLVGRADFRSPIVRAASVLIVIAGSFSAIYAWFRFVGQESFLGF